MKKPHNEFIEECTWQHVRDQIHVVNSDLAQIIDAWDPPDRYKLIKVRYQYGDRILRDGMLQLPMKDGALVPFNNLRVPAYLTEQLSYSNVPLGILTKNGCEVFLEDEDRVISLAFFTPGVILGLWETLEPESSYFPRRIWEVSAGARSLFMLPKISQAGLHENLKKKYGVRLSAPKDAFAHAPIFTEIAHSKNFNGSWYQEIIFFGSEWNKRNIKDVGWLGFHHHLLEQAWELSGYSRNTTTYGRVWQLFARYLEENNIKPTAYIMDTLKHIVAIGGGFVTGYSPSVNNEMSGPVKEFQDIYLQDYGLKNYIPTMMMPSYFNKSNKYENIYYSLQMPSLFTTLPKSRNQSSVMSEIRELKSLIKEFYQAALADKLKIENTPFEWLVNNVEFEFFHSDEDVYGEIQPSSNIPIEDKDFIYLPGKMRGRKFSETSSFVRGCVRLSHKKY